VNRSPDLHIHSQALLPEIVKERMAPGQVIRLLFEEDCARDEDWICAIDTRRNPA